MVERNFGKALAAGMVMAGGIGLSVFIFLLIEGLVASDDLFFLIFVFLGVVSVLLAGGSVLTGALIGAAAGRRSPRLGPAAGAGFLSGLLGQLFIIFCVFAGMAVFGALTDDGTAEEDPFIEDEEEEPVPWSEFGEALIFLIPASLGGVAGAIAFAPWTRDDMAPEPHTHHAEPGDTYAEDEDMRPMRCPSCAHHFEWPRGQRPTCPACGFSG